MATQPGTLVSLTSFTSVARTSHRGTTFQVVGDSSAVIAPITTFNTSLPPATASTPVVVIVTGGNANIPLRRAWIDVAFPGILASEVIHNGSQFGVFYTNPINTRTSYVDAIGRTGYQYTILRDGGWPVGAFPVIASFNINAVDTIGNGT